MFRKTIGEKIQKGYTFIEAMIVVAIIGILLSIAIPNFLAYQQKKAENIKLNVEDESRLNKTNSYMYND